MSKKIKVRAVSDVEFDVTPEVFHTVICSVKPEEVIFRVLCTIGTTVDFGSKARNNKFEKLSVAMLDFLGENV